jgi:type III secretion protein N (ATPase)
MRIPDTNVVLNALTTPQFSAQKLWRMEGCITELNPILLRATLPNAKLGELCQLPDGSFAEVIGSIGEQAVLSPYQEPIGLSCGMWVRPLGHSPQIPVGSGLLGRVVNALGTPIDDLDSIIAEQIRTIEAEPPNPMHREVISQVFPTGVRAIDSVLSVGVGQRLGIFAPAGCGKSTLLGMLMAGAEADVIVLALIGERGREVAEFLEHTLPPEARERSVIVVATSDRPALERLKAAGTATAIAEYFRDQGLRVLLLVDSLTRYARAVREIALAAGEPIVGGGYPPSLYARLPRLLERAGPAEHGSITAFYTVLMEDKTDPLSEEVRSLLDGHIVLARRLAEANHFPAIDVLASVSRVMNQITSLTHRKAAAKLRRLLATWKEVELLVRVGEYQAGQDAEVDEAVELRLHIEAFLQQSLEDIDPFDSIISDLYSTVKQPC